MIQPNQVYTARELLEAANVPNIDSENFLTKNDVRVAGIAIFNFEKRIRVKSEGKIVVLVGQDEYNVSIETE